MTARASSQVLADCTFFSPRPMLEASWCRGEEGTEAEHTWYSPALPMAWPCPVSSRSQTCQHISATGGCDTVKAQPNMNGAIVKTHGVQMKVGKRTET